MPFTYSNIPGTIVYSQLYDFFCLFTGQVNRDDYDKDIRERLNNEPKT